MNFDEFYRVGEGCLASEAHSEASFRSLAQKKPCTVTVKVGFPLFLGVHL